MTGFLRRYTQWCMFAQSFGGFTSVMTQVRVSCLSSDKLKSVSAFARNPGDHVGLGGQQGSLSLEPGLCCTLGFMTIF